MDYAAQSATKRNFLLISVGGVLYDVVLGCDKS